MRRTFSALLDCRNVTMFKILYLFPALLLTGCQLIPALPPVDLKDPAWNIVEGQAVWRANSKAPELAGEFLLATNVNNAVYFQFSKPPFPVIVAQSTSKGWQLEIPTRKKTYSGPGAPPSRIIWLRLPALLRGDPPPKNWTWTRKADSWTLKNQKTGESIEGLLTTETKPSSRFGSALPTRSLAASLESQRDSAFSPGLREKGSGARSTLGKSDGTVFNPIGVAAMVRPLCCNTVGVDIVCRELPCATDSILTGLTEIGPRVVGMCEPGGEGGHKFHNNAVSPSDFGIRISDIAPPDGVRPSDFSFQLSTFCFRTSVFIPPSS